MPMNSQARSMNAADRKLTMPQGYGYGERNINDDEDLYEGFNYSIDLAPPQTGSKPQSGYGGGYNPPGSSYRAPPSQMGRNATPGRLNTGQSGGPDARPMTSVSGAGFSSNPQTASGRKPFDPLGESRGPAPPLAEQAETSPEEKAKAMEMEVHKLLEESAAASLNEEFVKALDLAKDCGKKERQLSKFRTAQSLEVSHELTYGVLFNLANAYHLNEMPNEAIQSYTLIVKNKQFPQAGRLRVNMGNIYYEQKKYPTAIKMYRMALDQIPSTCKEIRFRIMRNIGNAFVRMGQFQDAIQSYEEIMENSPEFQTGFNLIVCYYALGDADRMRRGFSKLVNVGIEGVDNDEDEDDESKTDDGDFNTEIEGSDTLKAEIREREKKARYFLLTTAKLCAPVLDRKDWTAGYDWLIDTIKPEHPNLATELEICKAVSYLKNKQFERAIEVLKSFEKKDQKHKAMAAINLSFLYFIEGDIEQADKYANMAVRHQRYNAKALVNKGNCLVETNDLERAKELYLEAIGVEADCYEAIYNLGLVNKRMGSLNESLQAFEKLHSILPNNTEVIYQIANLHDLMNNYRQAAKWFNILITCFGTSSNVADPGVLSRLGQVFNKDDDQTQAFHYHLESYRYFPVNLEVISWLGVWYVKSELYEKSIQFFERASQIQPTEVKWRLMVTSCYRRMGSYQKALVLYEKIHEDYPENLECLRYLVAICKDLGHPYDQYQQELAKLERVHAARTQQTNAGVGALTRVGGAPENNAVHDTRYQDDPKSSTRRSPESTEFKDDRSYHSPPKKQLEPPPTQAMSTKERNLESKAMSPQQSYVDADQSDEWGDADVGDLLAD